MDENIHEEYLSQPLQTNNKQFRITVTSLTGYNGIFNVKDNNNEFYFIKSITDEDGYIQIIIPPGAYKIENLNNENQRNITDQEHYTESNYPFTIKPNFSTLGPIIEVSPQGPVIAFVPDDSLRDLLEFNKTTIFGEYNLSPNIVDILSFDKFLLECDIARGMINKRRRSGKKSQLVNDR